MTDAIRTLIRATLLLAVTSCASASAPDRVVLPPPTAPVSNNVSWELVGTDWGEPDGAREGDAMCELARPTPAPAGRPSLAPSSCAD